MSNIWARIKNFLGGFLLLGLGGLLVALGLRAAQDKEVKKTVDEVKKDLKDLNAERMVKEHAERASELTQQAQSETSEAAKAVEEAREAVQEAIETIKTSQEVLEKNKQQSAELQKKAEALKQEAKKKSDKLNKIISGTLILVMCFCALVCMPSVARAEQATPAPSQDTIEPVVPKDYDTLLKCYLELLDVAIWYRDAFEEMQNNYDKAEAGRIEVMHQLELQIEKNNTLVATVDKLNQTIATLTARVDTLSAELTRQNEESAKAIAEYREAVNTLLEQINKLLAKSRTYPIEIKGEVRYDGIAQSLRPYVVVEFRPAGLLELFGR